MSRRELNRLSAKFVETIADPGRYADGGGLYLQVSQGKHGVTKSWLFRYMRGGTTSREMGLGPVSTSKRDGFVTTKEARDRALKARESLKAGLDPLEAKRSSIVAARLDRARAVTFAQCADEYIEGHAAGWKGSKHARDWRGTLAKYVLPEIGGLPVAAIDTALVLKVLKPIWETKTKTAVDVRSRIELILSWAKIHGHRDGENPARWKGHLDNALPKPSKVSKVQHHPAMPYADVPNFLAQLRGKTAFGALALEWTILAAARSDETLGAEWAEIDVGKKVWTLPAARMKADADHRVPLTPRMLEILKSLPRSGKYVFQGASTSRMSMMFSML